MEVLSESRFYMWRAIFAIAHADGVVAPDELEFIQEHTANVPFSDGQKAILAKDLANPQNVVSMFKQVKNEQDIEDFFTLARILCWSDGDFDKQERKIMKQLADMHSDQEWEKFLMGSRISAQSINHLPGGHPGFLSTLQTGFFSLLNGLVARA